MSDASSSDLIIKLPAVPNVATFTDEKEFDKLYDAILNKVKEHVPDVSTKTGREAIASLAYKVARTKTTLDNQGKGLTEEWRKNTTKVNATRNLIKERLEALQERVRKPLTDWETAEDQRVTKHETALQALTDFVAVGLGRTCDELKDMLTEVNATPVDDQWEEFQSRAFVTKQMAVDNLTKLLAAAEKQEADAMELEQLRAAAAERERLDAEKLASENAAKEEAERLEREKQDEEARKVEAARIADEARELAAKEAQARIDAAEQQAKDAEARAQREIEEAKAAADRQAEAERTRIANENAAAEAEQARRNADEEHRRTINKTILTELVNCSGITPDQAQKIVIHLVKGLVPNVTLKY
jgi:hypothetical protein